MAQTTRGFVFTKTKQSSTGLNLSGSRLPRSPRVVIPVYRPKITSSRKKKKTMIISKESLILKTPYSTRSMRKKGSRHLSSSVLREVSPRPRMRSGRRKQSQNSSKSRESVSMTKLKKALDMRSGSKKRKRKRLANETSMRSLILKKGQVKSPTYNNSSSIRNYSYGPNMIENQKNFATLY